MSTETKVTRTAESTGFPEEVWLDIRRGEWPWVFPTEDTARRWASEGDPEFFTTDGRARYVVGPIAIPRDLPARCAKVVPQTSAWADD